MEWTPPQSAPSDGFNDKMIFPFRFMAEVEQHVRNTVGLRGRGGGREGRGWSCKQPAPPLFWREFVGCAFDGKRMWPSGSPANLQQTNWIGRGGAGQGGVPSSVLGDGVMSLGSGVEKWVVLISLRRDKEREKNGKREKEGRRRRVLALAKFNTIGDKWTAEWERNTLG